MSKAYVDKPSSFDKDVESLAKAAFGPRGFVHLNHSPGIALGEVVIGPQDLLIKGKQEGTQGWHIVSKKPELPPTSKKWEQKIDEIVARSLAAQAAKLRSRESELRRKLSEVDRVLDHPLVQCIFRLEKSRAEFADGNLEVASELGKPNKAQSSKLESLDVIEVDLTTDASLPDVDKCLPVYLFRAATVAEVKAWLDRYSLAIVRRCPTALFFWLRLNDLEPWELLAMNSLPVQVGFHSKMSDLQQELQELDTAVETPVTPVRDDEHLLKTNVTDRSMNYEDLNEVLRVYGSGTVEL